MEALLCGNPIISTNCGGIHEYLTDGKDAILLPYTLTPVQGNSRNQQWYCSDQQWAEVDTEALSNAMMDAYTKREQFAEMGKEGSNTVQVCFSLEHVGNKMLERLEQIRSN
jgi:glycosyltransferase involved in cell wall biosynthesis